MKKQFVIGLLVAGGLWSSGCEKKESTAEEVTATEQNASAGNAVPANDPATNPNVTSQEAVNTNAAKPAMTFKKTEHDFGTINQDKRVQHTFSFTNTGQAPLVIQDATATCGCTVPEWPKEPVMPGETGTIKVEFDPAGKLGQQSKQITIRANTEPAENYLTIKTNIVGSVPQAGAAGPVRLN
ncbi:DUF1573 domain-containing protein [Rufibacter roseus]|uniref:DUF1573 domain-containing protein n=1 Tax=Rufibacter roseus TaxID=1567108 RepID=A0ABW2DIW2_9BACT|nr:DUF1573 domain-containing protein [Rufibacter roseus]